MKAISKTDDVVEEASPRVPVDPRRDEEPHVVLRASTFVNGQTLMTVKIGQLLTDPLLGRRAREAGVEMLPESQSHSHASCPSCGHVFELPKRDIESRYAGMTTGELSVMLRR